MAAINNISSQVVITVSNNYRFGADFLRGILEHLGRKYSLSDVEKKVSGVDGDFCTYTVSAEIALPEHTKVFGLIYKNFGISEEAILEASKNGRKPPNIVITKDLICFVLRYRFGFSSNRIARMVGAKCHASAILSYQKFDTTELDYDGWLLDDVFQDAMRRYHGPHRLRSKLFLQSTGEGKKQ